MSGDIQIRGIQFFLLKTAECLQSHLQSTFCVFPKKKTECVFSEQNVFKWTALLFVQLHISNGFE